MQECACVYMCVHVRECMCVYMCMYAHGGVCLCACVCMYMYVCVCVLDGVRFDTEVYIFYLIIVVMIRFLLL